MRQSYKKVSNNFIQVSMILLMAITGYYFYISYTGYATAQNAMFFSALIFLFLVLFAVLIKNIFSKMAYDDHNLQKLLKHIKNNQKLKHEHDLKQIFLKQDQTEIYQFLEKLINEFEESTELAEQANKAKSLFLANMSHEIRTPLNGIVGFTDLMKSSNLNKEQEEYVRIIQASSENLLSIINDILDISKIESEKIEIENIEFNPIQEFEDGIESYGAKASEKNIDFGFFIDPTLSNKLLGDPSKIKQVLVNLISNAVKFTPYGGKLDVHIKKVISINGEAVVEFSVKDSGIGVSAEQKKSIFEAFSQADSSTSRKYGGTGLGLTISKKLVKLMGGDLDLKSEESKGSTFFFTLKFEETSSGEKNQIIENISTGYLLPTHDKSKQSDAYVETYISVLNPNYKIFKTIESLLLLAPNEQPDLLFVDFDCLESVDLIKLDALQSKIVLLTTIQQKDEVEALNMNFFKTLYAPINFSKINKSFFDVKNEEIQKDIVKDEENKYLNVRVLVAEDNLINQKLIKVTLEHFGINVLIADNGKKAYKLRCTQEFDLIFMDIQMPIMNGIESTRFIRSYEKENELKHIPIVALTANALKGDKERFLAVGMDEYISKPIKLDTIKNILNLYFSESAMLKINNTNIIEAEKKESVDILLGKHTKADQTIFRALLQKIGYSVDCVGNIDALHEMLATKNYEYVLMDRSLSGLSEDNQIIKIMNNSSIKSILFVDDRQSIRKEDEKNYTRVVRNTANMKFLEHIVKTT